MTVPSTCTELLTRQELPSPIIVDQASRHQNANVIEYFFVPVTMYLFSCTFRINVWLRFTRRIFSGSANDCMLQLTSIHVRNFSTSGSRASDIKSPCKRHRHNPCALEPNYPFIPCEEINFIISVVLYWELCAIERRKSMKIIVWLLTL